MTGMATRLGPICRQAWQKACEGTATPAASLANAAQLGHIGGRSFSAAAAAPALAEPVAASPAAPARSTPPCREDALGDGYAPGLALALAERLACCGLQPLLARPCMLPPGTRGFAAGQARSFASVQPEHAVYSGPQSAQSRRVTLRTLCAKHARGEPITMVTAYDYPSAVHVDAAGIDILLVGDSVGMVVHGHDTTLPVTLEDMLVHCRAVSRGARRPLLVGDLPFGSYEASPESAVRSAVRLLKEGTMDAVKLEGGGGAREVAAHAVVSAGIAVMGHCGLLPQSISVLGGFRPQGQSAGEALRVVREARALQDAGCFALVLECVPAVVAAAATSQLDIPTIGIGAGPHCSGQVLVYHDLLGMMQHPHHAKVTPKFCKQYAAIGTAIQGALQQYRDEVASREFPSAAFSPYRIADEEVAALERALHSEGMQAAAQAVAAAREAHHAASADWAEP